MGNKSSKPKVSKKKELDVNDVRHTDTLVHTP